MNPDDIIHLPEQLFVKLAVRTLVIAILVGLLTGSFETVGLYYDEKEGREGEISYLLNASYQPASRAAYTLDRSLAQEVLHGLAGVPSIYQVKLTDEHGAILADFKRDKFAPGFVARTFFPEERQYRVALKVPDDMRLNGAIAKPEEQVGELFLALDMEQVAQHYQHHLIDTFADEILHSLLIALLISLVSYFVVTRPLARIAGVLSKLHPGNLAGQKLGLPDGHKSDEIGMVVKSVNTLLDEIQISDEWRNREEEKLRLYATIFQNSHDSVTITDTLGNIIAVNPAFSEITGYTREEVMGKNPRILQSGRQGKEYYTELWSSLIKNGYWTGEVWNRRKDGSLYAGWLSITAVRNADGALEHYVGVTSDITEYKAAQERIRHMAFYDQLTGLPNRSLLRDRVERLFAQAQREEMSFALMFIDLDNFKRVNDSLGHHVGDLLLQEVAHRLHDCVRDSDTVSRQGGDEFVVLLPDTRIEGTESVASKILVNLSLPHQLEGQQVVATPSIGISLYPQDAQDFETLVKHADTALYRVKESGRAGIQFFTPEMNIAAHERMVLENALRQAIEKPDFVLHYQPQLDLLHGRVVGMEALIRWKDAKLGTVPPDDFIPIAEENGLIVPIGAWVLRVACIQNKIWQSMGLPNVPVSVNVSAIQIRQPDFIQMVAAVLRETGLEAKYLELELTEREVMRDVDQTIRVMNQLEALGVSLVVDDFGTGYSSLAYLKRFPLKKLKIDKSFVHELALHADDREISNAIIRLAHSLNLEVVAEGVESTAQLDILRGQGCDAVQGYYFSKPLPVEEFTVFLRSALGV